MSRVRHVEYELRLPADSTVEIAALAESPGRLLAVIEVANGTEELRALATALRQTIEEINDQIAFLEGRQ